MKKSKKIFLFPVLLVALPALISGGFHATAGSNPPLFEPRIEEPWWTVAGDPNLGELTDPKQQPVDFAVWQAADGTWQLWSCIRKTRCGGNTRLFYGWEGKNLTDPDWKPMGIAMRADPTVGETPGGLQAPHVVKVGSRYYMAYGDWEHICLAIGEDGKSFTRLRGPENKTGMFTEGLGANTRDAMLLEVDGTWHCYYTAYPNRQGAVFCRLSKNLAHWSDSVTVASGGQAGANPYSAECPHVVPHEGRYYLFRTQRYGKEAQTSIYHSTDPLMFGINQDQHYFLKTLPVAAPEIILQGGKYYIASLLPSLKGIQIARLQWIPRETKMEAKGVTRAAGGGSKWIDLIQGGTLKGWKPAGRWENVGGARRYTPEGARRELLAPLPGKGVLLNGPTGHEGNLFTELEHADVEAHIEFLVSQGSNSGAYFMGRYEIQILDSFGKEKVNHGDCGGIYQRWDPKRGEGNEGFEGHPPGVNVSKAPGAWQTFDVIFRAPRFDEGGVKTSNAKFIQVIHNGAVVHRNVEVTGPTRAAGFQDEKPRGPLMLQGDHGPVAFRNIRIRHISMEPDASPKK